MKDFLWKLRYWRFKQLRREMEYQAFRKTLPEGNPQAAVKEWQIIKYENYIFGVWD